MIDNKTLNILSRKKTLNILFFEGDIEYSIICNAGNWELYIIQIQV